MLVLTDTPNHPAIVSHKQSGHLMMIDGSIIHFDELLYFDHDNSEWDDTEPPYYYFWNRAENYRSGVSVSNVKIIYFKDDRISQASI